MSINRKDPERFFKTDHLQRNLKSRAVRGGSLTVGGQGAKFVLRLVSTAILARLLTPEDYGLMGMTLVVSGFVGVMSEGGLIQATVQKEAINHQEVSLLFWINVAIGISVALLTVAVSPLVALLFSDPRLTALLATMSITFVLGGCSVQHKALLRRNMRFGSIAVIEIISMLLGIVAAIAIASYGYGYWALVWLEIVRSVLVLILSCALLPWVPSITKWNSEVISTLKFGGNIVVYNVVNYISRNADNLLIGWYWGASTLGLYTRAYSLLMLPVRNVNAPFAAVAVPVLSRAKDDLSRLRRFFIEAASMVSAVVIPIVFCATVFANDLVWILLGEKWMATANLFRLLSVPAMLFGASQPISWLYVVLDRTHLLRNVGLVSAPINVIAFCIGLPYGPEGVATGYMVSSIVLYFPILSYALKGTGINTLDVLGTWIEPMVAATVGALAGAVVKYYVFSEQSGIFVSLSSVTTFGVVYAAMMAFVFKWRERAIAWYSRKSPKGSVSPPVVETTQ